MLKWVSDSSESIDFEIPYALKPIRTAHETPGLDDQYRDDWASCWEHFPKEIASQLDLFYFLRGASDVLETNKLLVETLRESIKLWSSIFRVLKVTTSETQILTEVVEELKPGEKMCVICRFTIGEVRSVLGIEETLPAEKPMRFCCEKHIFGKDCIEQWIKDKQDPTCPLCRYQAVPYRHSSSSIRSVGECISPWWISILRGDETPQARINEELWIGGRQSIRPHIPAFGLTQEDIDEIENP